MKQFYIVYLTFARAREEYYNKSFWFLQRYLFNGLVFILFILVAFSAR